MKKKLKDKKIILYRYTSIQGNNGYPVNSYTPIHPGKVWAYVRQLSAKEFYAAAMLQNKEEMIFVINWRKDLDPMDTYILYKGVWYDIQRIDTFEDYKADLSLYAMQTRTPEDNEILPYAE